MSLRLRQTSSPHPTRRALATIVAALLLVLTAAPLAGAATAAGGRATSRAPRLNPLQLAANSVSCVTTTLCVAVGQKAGASQGEVAVIVKGKQAKLHPLSGVTGIGSVACLKGGCTAVGFRGSGSVVIAISKKGVPGKVRAIAGGTKNTFLSIACAHTLASCEASGQGGSGTTIATVAIRNGKPAKPKSTAIPGAPFTGGTAISCGSTRSCIVVGPYTPLVPGATTHTFALPLTKGKPGKPKTVSKVYGLTGISCASAGHCVVAGDSKKGVGMIGTLTGTSLSKIHTSSDDITKVSCRSTKACIAVGSTLDNTTGPAVVFTVTKGKPGAAQMVTGAATFVGVDSLRSSFYEAVGPVDINGTPGTDVVAST